MSFCEDAQVSDDEDTEEESHWSLELKEVFPMEAALVLA